MKSFIVEDSRLARVELHELLKSHKHIQICGEASNPRDALPMLIEQRPELLFLDINMPGKNGFELLQELNYEPKVIFITAHAEYALRSFEFSTIDYLLKPITAERLKTALDKLSIQDHNDKTQTLLSPNSRVLLRSGERCHWVCLQDIHYFESTGNQTKVYWESQDTVIPRALSSIEARLPDEMFFRANRQQILNINAIKKIDSWFNKGYTIELKSGANIEVSRRHAMRFKDLFCL